jgi:hypothetical protein
VLVRHWRRVCTGDESIKPTVLGLLCATLYWFNPAVLMNAHVWPQWDTWLAPFFVWAIYLGLINRWAAVGALVLVGAMLKGQMVAIAPLFLLWPLFAGRFWGAGRFVIGFVLSAFIITLPWLIEWNFNWYEVGFEYGQRHYIAVNMGETYNLPAIMAARHGWRVDDPVSVPTWIDASGAVSFRIFSRLVFGVMLTLCAISAAIYDRRKNLHFLIAIVSPWLFLYAFTLQMHERYLVWFGALSALFACLGPGWAMLHLLVAVLATIPMTRRGGLAEWDWWPRFMDGLNPGMGWAILVIALMCLYFCFVPMRKPVLMKADT